MVSSTVLQRTGAHRGQSCLKVLDILLSFCFQLDGDEEHGSIFDDEIDFYGQVHLPI